MEKRYEYHRAEQTAQELWQHENAYKFAPGAHQKIFSIDTPPPTVSGSLHIGHVFSYTHTDIIARYQRMRGAAVFYPMGFDANGLATERFVEKTHKIKGHHMERSAFISLCLDESHRTIEQFKELWRKLGLSIDWNHTYTTISPAVQRVAQYSFIELFNKGYAYRKEEPSLYCPTCRTSVAQAELESATLPSTFNQIALRTQDGSSLIIATTRPELIGACQAVLAHPNDARYAHLIGTMASLPIYNRAVPIIADDEVQMDKGTGLVMTCSFGDQQDIAWFKKHNLAIISAMLPDGTWSAAMGPIAGLRAQEARKKILELLNEDGALLKQEAITHAVNVHERCKQEIEFLVLKQWFINILDHKEALLARGEQVNWHPSFMHARYKDWVEHLSWDWCISRQRFFGIPFPVWHCNDCNAIVLARLEELPIDPQETGTKGRSCPRCTSTNLSAETDVMDTWNTSSLTPQINMGWPDTAHISLPMSMRPQAHDIIRTWAFYTIVKAHIHQNNIPWRDIVISGHVLAGKSGKISKSQGGAALTPESLLSEYPADAIRYWSASAAIGVDTAFSDNQLKIGNRLITKLWNAFKFIGEHTQNAPLTHGVPNLDLVNSWLCHEFNETVMRYCTLFDRYEYQHALGAVETFFWQIFCDNYLELIKDQFFNPQNYDAQVLEATRFVLRKVGFGLLQLFAPFVPHVTEALYQEYLKEFKQEVSLHTTVLMPDHFAYHAEHDARTMKYVLEIIDAVRKLKSEHKLSLKTPLTSLTIGEACHLEGLTQARLIIAGITKAAEVNFETGACSTELIVDGELLHARVMLNSALK